MHSERLDASRGEGSDRRKVRAEPRTWADPEPSDDAGTHPRHLTRPLFALAQIGPASQSGCRAGIAAPPAGLWASERFCMQQPFACALAMLLPCHLYVCLMSRICMMCAGGVRSVRSMSGRRGRWRQCRAGGAHAWQHDVYTVRCACAPSAQLFVGSWLVWLNLHARLSAARDSRDERVLHVGAEKLWNIGKTSV